MTCACPYHDSPCASPASVKTRRYGMVCPKCLEHMLAAWAENGMKEFGLARDDALAWAQRILDTPDPIVVQGGIEIWKQRRNPA